MNQTLKHQSAFMYWLCLLDKNKKDFSEMNRLRTLNLIR